MGYSGVFVFGDSLVDAGNVLKLADFADNIPLIAMPNGLPTADKGYYKGRFTDGLTFADLISNKFISVPTTSVFPFGYEDPLLGISFTFVSDPNGNNLNFAYGGAQIRGGSSTIPNLDDQTDAYRDAVDGRADGNALHLITIGGNDVRALVPATGAIVDAATAATRLSAAAAEYYDEVRQLISIGAQHILVTGIPDVGIVPHYEGTLDEAARRAAATQYSDLLDGMIQQYLGQLRTAYPGVELHYVSLVDAAGSVLPILDQIFDPAELAALANDSDILFFDNVHPTAQAHAILAGYILDGMSDAPAGATLALKAPDYSLAGVIGVAGEVDSLVISLAANTSYTFELLGISSGFGSLADPALRIVGPGGFVATEDDGGLGLDARFRFTTAQAGDYVIELDAVGSLSGSYRFQATGEASGDNTYLVSNGNAIILEQAGDGYDSVLASVSYALAPGVSVERLATPSQLGKTAINLTGNALDQSLFGNAGNNVLDGKGGADSLWGGAGKDFFAFTAALDGRADVLEDFNVRDDTIQLDDAVFAGLAGGTLAKGAFVTGTSARQADDRILYDPISGHLYFDPDGSGALAAVHFATVDAGLRLTASDFVVI